MKRDKRSTIRTKDGVSAVFECIDFINECYNEMCGEDIPINYFNSELKIQNQMIYWVGYEFRQELLENCDYEDEPN